MNQYRIKTLLFFVIAFAFTNFIYPQMSENQNHNLIAKDAVLTKLSDQYSFTEGPAADKKGNIYFTDQPNNRIMNGTYISTLRTTKFAAFCVINININNFVFWLNFNLS